jgi:uncharacterized protein YgbK (DUF1537 family)
MATAEILADNGIPTVVFSRPPPLQRLEESFPGIQAEGIAGTTRILPVDKLGEELAPVFRTIEEYEPRVVLYKVCSTFDSSENVGNIGKAIEIGREIFSPEIVPILPAAPDFERYTMFGNHFAGLGREGIYRLDRHPSLSLHPTTPMKESDLRRHLQKKTRLPVGLIDILVVSRGVRAIQQRIRQIPNGEGSLVLFDCLFKKHINQICSAVLETVEEERPVLFVGSHEFSPGFVHAMKELVPASGESVEANRPVSETKPILIVSGSFVTVTGNQILWARERGYLDIAVRTQSLLDPNQRNGERARVVKEALRGLREGKSVIVHAAIGPQDHRIEMVREVAERLSLSTDRANERIGSAMGEITKELVQKSHLKRMAVAGGDTSGVVQKSLDIDALQIRAVFRVPAPLCLVHSPSPDFNGLEIAFKGGQVGGNDYFNIVRCA